MTGEDRIAIVGMAGRFPGAEGIGELWEQSVRGRIGIDALPGGTRGSIGARGVLARTDCFDAGFFGVTPREARLMDPQQRVLLEIAQHALDDAGVDPARANCPVAVYVACGPSTRPMAAVSLSEQYEAELATSSEYAATRISYRLGLRGESITVQTGCSSSLVAVHLAVQSLLSGQSDIALAGGVSFPADQSSGYFSEDGMIASPSGRCRPFDAGADGAVPGGGAAIVVLKRLPEATADGSRIHAVILGSALNNDGATKVGFMAPSPVGQAEAIATAYAVAGVIPRTVGYVETHGTGTKLGDAIEIEGLRRAFASVGERPGKVALGSLKANTGHLDRAAGVAGLVRAVMAVRHGVIPPMAGFDRPNPELGLEEAGFFVPAAAMPWPARLRPRRAGVSAFGVGGTNAHVVIEEAPPVSEPGRRAGSAAVLAVSGRDSAAVRTFARSLADHLEDHPSLALPDVAHTLASGRRQHPVRAYAVAEDTGTAAARLRSGLAPVRALESPTIVFAFPGQADEVVDGLPDVYRTEPVFRSALDDCAAAIAGCGGPDIDRILYGERSHIAKVRLFEDMGRFQPAMFAVQWALAELWRSWGVRADAVIGHSLGEVVAAAYSGVFSLEEALRLVVERGRLMERTAPGAMISVTMNVAELTSRLPDGVWIAAINGHELAAVTGPPSVITEFAAVLTAEGIGVRPLHIHRSPHGPAMAEPARRLGELAGTFRLSPPRIPILSNVTGDWADERMATAEYWAAHLRCPVRFADEIERLAALPSPIVLEVGPGSSLSKIIAHEMGGAGAAAMPVTLAAGGSARTREELLDTAGRLWSAGVAVDLDAAAGSGCGRIADLPLTHFDHSHRWPAIPTAPAAPTALAAAPVRHADPGAWLYEMVMVPYQGDGRGSPAASIAWLGDGEPLRSAVVAAAAARGQPLSVCSGISELSRCLAEKEATVVWWAGAAGDGLLPQADKVAMAVAGGRGDAEVWAVVPAANKAPRLPSPANLALAAARVMPMEHPGAVWHMAEIAGSPGPETARALLDTVTAPVAGTAIRVGPQTVAEAAFRQAWPDWRARPLRADGCYVITGGIGRVGRALAIAIAREVRATIVLFGRRPPQAVEPDFAALRSELASRGSAAHYRQLDVTDATAMAAAFDSLRTQFKRVDGVVHAAGFTDRSQFMFLADSGAGLISRVAAAKVGGAIALTQALRDDDADFILLCSSLSTILGGVRFGAYAAANAALDDLARAQHERGDRRWISVAWDAWADDSECRGGPGPGRFALSAEDGYQAFRRLLAVRAPVAAVSTGDLAAREASRLDEVGAGVTAGELDGGPRQAAEDPGVAVRAVLADVLGALPADPHQDLRALGLESLTILQLVTRLRAALAAPIALADAMRSLTVAGLEDLARAAVADPGRDAGDGGPEWSISAVAPRESYPTSSLQRRWLELADEGYGGIDIAINVAGKVDTAALADAVRQVTERHSGLRTVFRRESGTWVQRVVPARAVPVCDLATLPAEEKEKTLAVMAAGAEASWFDMASEAPFESRVVRLDADRHVMLLHAHHVLFDGWSSSLFLRDVARAVRGELAGCPLQYTDYAVAEQQHQQGAGFLRKREHWRRHFEGASGPTRIPGGGLSDPADRGSVLRFTVSAEVCHGLRRRAWERGTTPFAVMMTAFAALLHGLTQEADLIVGTTAASRPSPETEEIIGVFVNPLPIRLRVDPDAPAGSLLRHVHEVLVGFHEHGSYPLEDLVTTVPPFIGMGLNDTFHCYLLYQNYWRPEPGELSFSPLTLPADRHHRLMREMEMVAEERGNILLFELWYRQSRYPVSDVVKWRDNFCDLMRLLACDDHSPGTSVRDLLRRADQPT